METAQQLLGLLRVSSVLPAEDATELKWYLRSGGMNVFSVSTFGAMLESARLYGATAVPCQRCGGNAEANTPGSGFEVSRASKGRAPTPYEREMLLLLEVEIPDLLPPAGDTVCVACQGVGWVMPKRRSHSRTHITARPTGSSVRGVGGGVDVDVVNMGRLGRVVRLLAQATAVDGRAEETLDAYYSPGGGTLLSLWHLVPAGKTLLRSNPQKLPPRQLFENLRSQHAEKPTPKRTAQFAAADKQALELLQTVCRAWNLAKDAA